ncbi:MAG: hypothetical protein ACM3X7_05650 [Solirubrobacterales bacterium]
MNKKYLMLITIILFVGVMIGYYKGNSEVYSYTGLILMLHGLFKICNKNYAIFTRSPKINKFKSGHIFIGFLFFISPLIIDMSRKFSLKTYVIISFLLLFGFLSYSNYFRKIIGSIGGKRKIFIGLSLWSILIVTFEYII